MAIALPEPGAATGDEHGRAVEGARRAARVAPSAGGSGQVRWVVGHRRRLSSRCSSAVAVLGPRRPELGEVVGLVDERLAMSSSAIDERTSGSARWRITRRAIFTVTAGAAAIFSAISRAVASSSSAGTTRDTTPWRERLLGVHRPAGEHHVAHDAVAADLEQPADAAGVGDHAVADLGQHEPRALGRDADVAQQRPLERCRRSPSPGWPR